MEEWKPSGPKKRKIPSTIESEINQINDHVHNMQADIEEGVVTGSSAELVEFSIEYCGKKVNNIIENILKKLNIKY